MLFRSVLKVDQAKNQISLSMKLEVVAEHKSFREQRDQRPAPAQQRNEAPRADFNKNKGDYKPRDPKKPAAKFEPSKNVSRNDNRPGQSQRPSNPFNNPFAALLNQGNTKK